MGSESAEKPHPSTRNTKENPLIYKPDFADKAQYQWCKCKTCQKVALCVPEFDFFGKVGEPMECEFCFLNRHGLADRPTLEVTPLPGETLEQALVRYNKEHGTNYELKERLE